MGVSRARRPVLLALLVLAVCYCWHENASRTSAGDFIASSWEIGDLSLLRLRVMGEEFAGRYSGTSAMGLASSRTAPAPVDWKRLEESCSRPGNSTYGANRVVLVTGAAGFIGMHTAVALRRRGDAVVGLDNFNDYYSVPLKRSRQLLVATAGVYIIDGDINDAALLRRLFRTCRFTHVVHLAAQAGARLGAAHPQSYVHANVAGQVAVLEAVKDQSPPPAVLIASSSSVYGLNSKSPFSESDSVDTPTSLYAATKRADELIAHTYHAIYRLDVTALRFFTVYGPWGRPDMAIFKFAVALMAGNPVPVFQGPGGEELSRDFTYIDDIVAGVLAAVDTSLAAPREGVQGGRGSPPPARYRIYNLGNTRPHTVSELVDQLEGHLGVTGRKGVVRDPPAGDIVATCADIEAARADLGYQPRTALADGVRAFSEWFLEYSEPAGGWQRRRLPER